MSRPGKKGLQIFPFIIFVVIAIIVFRSGSKKEKLKVADLPNLLAARTDVPRKEGIAVALVVDTSGSMKESVTASDGARKPKIDIARGAVLTVIRQVEGFSKDPANSGKPVMLGLHGFSGRSGQNHARIVLPMGTPSASASANALNNLRPDGDTPIGDAIVAARQALDATGLSKTHILVVTDGQNTTGLDPADVMAALAKLPEDQRPGVYFIA